MVKLTAPLMSMDASGTIAKTAVFARWKGRSYARSHVVPHNPKSVSQVGIRAMFKFLAQQWSGLGTTPQGTWSTIADALNISGFNAYMRAGIGRWRNFQAPTQATPASEDDTEATLNTWAATGGVRQIDLAVALTAAHDNWGCAIFRSTVTGFTPAWSNCIAIIGVTTTDATHYIDTPLAAAEYFYKHRLFTKAGILHGASAEVDAIAT